MSKLTITLESHVMALLQNLADERNASVQEVATEVIEGALEGQREKARQRLLALIDATEGDVGPITWKREDLYDR
ncbi:hypothetical protein SAMN02799631_03769 [Methylobacterium sp. 174MFSha1.1]|uniref:hypothetical protein n=1 Tax=Methylobacterium sp. 174MFSha1.1 TaxID=1502749 RepID=UPI0008DFA056|nr:hypothetical protein [Methylobacterium sp. 174MFSha1.1]SFU99985.1 hypothetical protein SAMN02799631_03769 [Methylobacterium sp. 174MFSha1.1]